MPDFLATSAVSGGGQLTLADIERALVPRVGPHSLGASGLGEEQSSGTAATTTICYIDAFTSSIPRGGIENLYVLRRGLKADGTTLAVVAGDRQRQVDQFDAATGACTVDLPWTTPPVATELLEFHHLDPARQLRPAVRDGLRRCYFEDRVSVTLSGAAAERDLTAVVSWITKRTQVRRVQFSASGSTAIPADQTWWNAFEAGGHVWLAGWRDVYPNVLYVTALRPHFTWVNGATSTTGPTADADLLSVDLDYAVAAAHIEAWKRFPSMMLQAAEAGYQANQASAADEFTRQARTNVRRKARGFSLSAPFGNDQLSGVAR